MREIICLFWMLFLVCSTLETDTTPSDVNNEIEPKPPLRLDPYIRKALLRALTELESNDTSTDSTTSDEYNEYTSTEAEILQTSDDQIDTPRPTVKDAIQYHSYIIDGQKAFVNTSVVLPSLVHKTLSALMTPAESQTNNLQASASPDPFNEEQSGNGNNQALRSVLNTPPLKKTSDKDNQKPSKQPAKTTLPPTPPTTTTPKPTHNKDGENVESVDTNDVQVFQAPLVAAFTVHQDAAGQPHKVVPIYKPNLPQPAVQSSQLHSDFVQQQFSLQQQLEQKQKLLEQQLYYLQLQQKQQEDLLKRQQLYQQQQLIKTEQDQFRQHQFLLNEEQRQRLHQQQIQQQQQQQQQQLLQQQQQIQQQQQLQQQQQQQQQLQQQQLQLIPPQQQTQTQSPHQHPQSLSVNQFQQQPFQKPLVSNQNLQPLQSSASDITFQPSISIEPSVPVLNQQLPNREAVDFLIHLRNQRPTQFPLDQNHLPPAIASFQQQLPVPTNFLPFDNFRPNPPITQQAPPAPRANRVFRQESGTANLGFNQNVNHQLGFSNFRSNNHQFNNRFPQTNRQNFPRFSQNSELQQLLLQSGISNGGRSHEDLNIVSKVLSLNHGIPPNQQISNNLNLLFGESQRHETKVPTNSG